jgi:lipoprotein-anchoring transpeptidase ErfK/SrfK
LRAQPTTKAPTLGELPSGRPIVVSGWVVGEEVIPDNPTWAVLSDTAFLYSSVLRPVSLPSAPPPPASASSLTNRWIDLNLLHQVVVAYEGSKAVRLARTSTGRPGWETAPGNYSIQRRVENETMDSTSLIGLDAKRADYKVENVRWTQYFSADGKALHENYWKPRDEFGIPSSHGCAGLVAEDARFFWDWAGIGVPVIAHF